MHAVLTFATWCSSSCRHVCRGTRIGRQLYSSRQIHLGVKLQCQRFYGNVVPLTSLTRLAWISVKYVPCACRQPCFCVFNGKAHEQCKKPHALVAWSTANVRLDTMALLTALDSASEVADNADWELLVEQAWKQFAANKSGGTYAQDLPGKCTPQRVERRSH